MGTLIRSLLVAIVLLPGAATAQQQGDAQLQAKRKACRDEAAMAYRPSKTMRNTEVLREQRRAHVQQCMGR